jgi:hypothetical protein
MLKELFLLPTIISLFVTTIAVLFFPKKQSNEKLNTQSKELTLLMLLVIFIQLVFGLTVFLVKA